MVYSSLSLLWPLLLLLLYATTIDATFRLGIRDSLMIAHSFHDHPAFGPAGGMHGATYTCDVEFCSPTLIREDTQWVMDIGAATALLARVLARYHLQNLDEVFGPNVMTTTEFMCRQIHQDLRQSIAEDETIDFTGDICVKLWESHKAWASYTG